MELTNLTIKDLLSEDKELTFLVGAGCSIDQPSCLPAGKAMMEELIRYTCHESEVETILHIEDLRFESLIEIIRDQLDKNLITIDYYGQCDKPNIQHFFLAEMINKGHFVMTTNFDFLIEYALLQSGVLKKDVVPVITQQEFEQLGDPLELINQGKKTLYKIHGSPKNVITNENTKDSLVATIQAFGSNKEGLDIFQLEAFKRPLFENITNQRSLVVMGYSGSDDFDVVPTLKVIKNLKEIIWIDFLYEDGGKEEVYTFDSSTPAPSQNLDKVNQILLDIYMAENVENIYRVNVNTSRIVKELMEKIPILSSEKFSLAPVEWLKNNLFPPSDVDKYFIAFHIYRHFNRYEEAISCMHMMSLVSGLQPDNPRHAHAYLNIAGIYTDKAEYGTALEFYEDAKQIYEKINDLDGLSGVFNGMALVYKKQGNMDNALKLYEKALELSKMTNIVDRIAIILDNMANIHREMGNLSKASECQEIALKIFGDKGMLKDRAVSLTNRGQTLYQKGNYEEALNHFDQALKISEQMNDQKTIGLILEAKASVYFDQKRLNEAAQLRSKAVDIFDRLGLKEDKAIALVNLAFIYENQADFFKALELYREAVHIIEKMNISWLKEEITKKFGIIRNKLASKAYEFLKQRNFVEAINQLKNIIQICEEGNDINGKAAMLIKLARIYREQGQPDLAIKCYEEAAQIFEESKEYKYMELAIHEMGAIYLNLGKSEVAIKNLENLMKLYHNENLDEKNVDVLFDLSVLYSRMREFDKAQEQLHHALNILIMLGLEDSEKVHRINRQIDEMQNQKRAKAKFENLNNRFNL